MIGKMEKEIKKCPFCNGKAHVSVRQRLFIGLVGEFGNKKIDYAAQVICNKCHARGGVVTETLITDGTFRLKLELLKDKAIEAWNRRADDEKTESNRNS